MILSRAVRHLEREEPFARLSGRIACRFPREFAEVTDIDVPGYGISRNVSDEADSDDLPLGLEVEVP